MLDCVNVVKRYGGKFAVNGMSVAIEDAHIYGLLGPNGSGKSTWMKMAAGLIVPCEDQCRDEEAYCLYADRRLFLQLYED